MKEERDTTALAPGFYPAKSGVQRGGRIPSQAVLFSVHEEGYCLSVRGWWFVPFRVEHLFLHPIPTVRISV